MATNSDQGLFAGGGNSLGNIQQLMQREKQARIRQAMADNAGAGGNYYSNLIAKSNAQLGETVKGIAQGLAGSGLGKLGASTPGGPGMLRQALPQDPRLSQAMKRDTDRREIMAELGKFSKVGSDGDEKMTEGEMRKGHAMLLAKGYVDEATKFLAQAQAEATLAINRTKAVNTGTGKQEQYTYEKTTKHKGKDNKEYMRTARRSKFGGKVDFLWFDEAGNKVEKPKGDLKSLGELDQTAAEIHDNRLDLISKRTVEYLKKDTGKSWNAFRTDKVETGILSSRIKGKMQQALELAKGINSGGLTEKFKELITDQFGTTPANVGLFNKIVGDVLIKELKKLGTRPTDADLKYLEDKLATLGQSKEVNMAILEDIIKEIDKDVLLGDALVDNPEWKLDDLNKNKDSIWSGAAATKTVSFGSLQP